MIQWQLKPFNELNLEQLYAILRLRQKVFIVEQNCPFMDADDWDQPSYHLMGYLKKELAAYSRIVPPGVAYKEVSIGRIVTGPKFRKKGYGKLLMQMSLDETENLYGRMNIRIAAQEYLRLFYEGYGFVKAGKPFLLDDIWHVEMLKTTW